MADPTDCLASGDQPRDTGDFPKGPDPPALRAITLAMSLGCLTLGTSCSGSAAGDADPCLAGCGGCIHSAPSPTPNPQPRWRGRHNVSVQGGAPKCKCHWKVRDRFIWESHSPDCTSLQGPVFPGSPARPTGRMSALAQPQGARGGVWRGQCPARWHLRA